MRIEWLPAAQESRFDQFSYVAHRDPIAARRLGDLIDASLLRLADYPNPGRPGRVPGTRELVIGNTPFLIYSAASAKPPDWRPQSRA